MATIQELEAALQRADSEGDVEATQALANAILKQRTVQSGLGLPDNPQPTLGEAVVNAAKGIGRGLTDPFMGLAQLSANTSPFKPLTDKLYKPLEDSLGLPLTSESFNKSVNEGEKKYQGGRDPKSIDFSRLVGNVVSPLNVVAGVAGGPSLMGNIISGAVTSSTLPTYGENYLEDKKRQVSMGALASGAAGLLTRGLGRVIGPQVPEDIQVLREMGVTPTIGHRLGPWASRIEQGLESSPLLGSAIIDARNRSIHQYNRGIGQNVLNRIGETLPDDVPAGRALINHVGDALERNYGNLLPNLSGQMDNQFRQEMANVQTMGLTLRPAQRDELDQILQHELFNKFTPQGMASGETLKEVEHQLGHYAQGHMRSPDFNDQRLGSALRESQRILRSMIERNNPQYRGELQAANSAWADFLRMEKASTKSIKNDGFFSPGNYLQSVKDLDPTRRKSQFARGEARLQDVAEAGQRVLGSTVPDSGTTFRSMLGLGLLGGSYAIHPGLMFTELGAALPYTSMGQRVVDSVLSGGMGTRGPAGRFINRMSPLVAAGSAVGAATMPPLSYTP